MGGAGVASADRSGAPTISPDADAEGAPNGVVPGAPTARRRIGSRLSTGHVVMIVAALLAALLNFSALRARDDTVRVAVAVRDVPAGAPVEADAVRFTDARLDDDVVATLLSPEQVARVEGWIATQPIAPGEPIRASDLRAPAAPKAQRAMSLPIDPAHAVAGALRSGDRIDVITVRDGKADYLVTDAEVLAASGPEQRGGLGDTYRYSVTLAVDDETALRLAAALHTGALDVVRSTGSTAVQPALDEQPAAAGTQDTGEDPP